MWWTYQQLRSRNYKTRLATVAKLAESKRPDSVPPLIFALKDPMAEVRTAAALALGPFQDVRTVEPLIKLLRDPVALVRATAVQALENLSDTRVVKELVDSLTDSDASVRLRAVSSLDRLGWVPEDESARKAHILASGNLDRVAELGADGIKPLVDLIDNGPPEKQLSAIKALSSIHDPRVPNLMLEMLGKNNNMVRLVALDTLERLADPSAFESVARLLTDSASNIRAAAVVTVASCDGSRAVPLIVDLLRDASWEVRFEAVKTLGRLGDARAVEGLCRVLQDKDHDVRESAANALGRIGDVRAIPSLVLALMDLQSFVRTSAHNALFRLDRYWKKSDAARSVLPKIKAACNHREYWISQCAEKLLEQIQPDGVDAITTRAAAKPASATVTPVAKSHPAIAILLDLLRDSDRDLRLAAATAFGDLRDTSAISQLLAASQDEDIFVRQAAEYALAGMN